MSVRTSLQPTHDRGAVIALVLAALVAGACAAPAAPSSTPSATTSAGGPTLAGASATPTAPPTDGSSEASVEPGPTRLPSSEPRYRITGTLTDAAGHPAKGYTVTAATEARDAWIDATTDTLGRYELRGLASGSHKLQVSCPSGWGVNVSIPVEIAGHDVLGVDARLPIELEPSPSPASFAVGRIAGPAEPLRVDAFARVLVDDLVVRAEPFVGEGSAILPQRLRAGDAVFLVAGPVAGSGYRWYQVAGWGQEAACFGWIAAAGRDGTSWLEGLAIECPSQPVDIATILAMGPFARLTCFGRATLSFVAYSREVGHPDGPACGLCRGEPGWLVGSDCGFNRIGDRTGPMLDVTYTPGVAGLDPGDRGAGFRIFGHFDDPASASCSRSCRDLCTDEVREDPPDAAQLRCRAQFVITGIEPL